MSGRINGVRLCFRRCSTASTISPLNASVRTVLFTGKGGVGKTTLSAATALTCAYHGHRTLVISTDIAHSLADALDHPLSNEPQAVGPDRLYAAELDSGAELERYWGDIKRRITGALRDQGVSATAAGELAVLPGLDEILALVRIKRYYDEGHFDVLIIDSAPTGAAMRLLAAPDLQRWYTRHLLGFTQGLARVLLPSLRNLVKLPIGERVIQERIGELFDHVEDLRGILTDGEQTSVRLVLNADHMSLRETKRAYTYMNLFGLYVDGLFVNRLLPDAVDDPFFTHWKEDQATHLDEINETFAPLPVHLVPLREREVVGLEQLHELGAALYEGGDPARRLSDEQPLRFYLDDAEGHYMLSLRVSGVEAAAVELEKAGDELLVRLGAFRRTIVLPQYLVGLEPAWARLEAEHLLIAFGEAENPV